MSDPHKDWDRKAWYATLLLLLTIVALVLVWTNNCGLQPSKRVVVGPSPAPTPPADDGGDDVGPPPPCTGVSFLDIKPIMDRACVSCHPGFDDYAQVSARAEEMVRRVNLALQNPQHMPREGELPLADKDLLKDWRDAGAPAEPDCDDGGGGATGFIDLDDVESVILEDLNGLDSDDRLQSRYLIVSHKIDEGKIGRDLAVYKNALNKNINSVNVGGEDEVFPAGELSAGIYRIDLETFGIKLSDWAAIEAADKLNIESFTTKGLLIKQLTGTAKPWYHFDNFQDITQRDSAIYYRLTDAPDNFNLLMLQLGVAYSADLANLDALLVGFNGSPLSTSNRLMSRHDSRDGYAWTTYDTGRLDAAEKNLFEFPLLVQTLGIRIFQFVAGETIYTLPNGLQGYYLSDAAGVRQDVAPVDVVRDFLSPVSSEIRNAVSCHRCHSGGLITTRDQIRDHVVANAAQFDPDDVEKVRALFKPAASLAANFSSDNQRFATALRRIGVNPSEPDPMSKASDEYLLDWDVERVATFLLLDTATFKELLNQSATGKAQVGQLLTGGKITYDQFVAVLPVLIDDLRLFQDPVDQ